MLLVEVTAEGLLLKNLLMLLLSNPVLRAAAAAEIKGPPRDLRATWRRMELSADALKEPALKHKPFEEVQLVEVPAEGHLLMNLMLFRVWPRMGSGGSGAELNGPQRELRATLRRMYHSSDDLKEHALIHPRFADVPLV